MRASIRTPISAAVIATMWASLKAESSEEPRCPEYHALFRDCRIGNEVVVGAEEGVDVDEVRTLCDRACTFVHASALAPRSW